MADTGHMAELHEDLESALLTLGISGQVPHLRSAADESKEALDSAVSWFEEHVPLDTAIGMDVLVFGSYARLEATGPSDFDYLVVAHQLPRADQVSCTRELLAAGDRFINEVLTSPGEEATAAPGRTGLFGRIASAPDLSERIGLEQDTNVSHTRRLLLLQESVSIYRPDLRHELVQTVLARYLKANKSESEPPRFLVNDFIRYWYTLAVDYQAKRWEHNEKGWGLRYLKLISSRKLTYAGTLATLLRSSDAHPATNERLAREFGKPPLARLAQLALDPGFDQHDALRDVLLFADEFAAFLANPDLRKRAEKVDSLEDMDADTALAPIRESAHRMDLGLKRVFLDSHLRLNARRYLVF